VDSGWGSPVLKLYLLCMLADRPRPGGEAGSPTPRVLPRRRDSRGLPPPARLTVQDKGCGVEFTNLEASALPPLPNIPDIPALWPRPHPRGNAQDLVAQGYAEAARNVTLRVCYCSLDSEGPRD
jgi:hypothetical protein